MKDLVVDDRDRLHPKPFVEGKHLDCWLPATNKWLEWGTERAPDLFSRPTFSELYEAPEKIFIHRTAGENIRCAYDSTSTLCNHTVIVAVPWHYLSQVRNRSIRKQARYRGEPRNPQLPLREELETSSSRFNAKYVLAVMNSSWATEFLRRDRRSNTDLYPNDWKKLPIPDASQSNRPQSSTSSIRF